MIVRLYDEEYKNRQRIYDNVETITMDGGIYKLEMTDGRSREYYEDDGWKINVIANGKILC